MAAGQPGQPAADLHRGLTADTRVDLVEHQRGRAARTGEDHLDGEHHPGQLAAGGALLQRQRRRARVRQQPQLHLVGAVRADAGLDAVDRQARLGPARRARQNRHLDAGVRHGQPGQLDCHLLGEADRRLASGRRDPAGEVGHLTGEPGRLAVQLVQQFVGGVQIGQPGPRPLGPRHHAVDVVGVLAGQPAQRGPPLVDGLEAGRVGVQRGQVGGQLRGHVGDERGRLLQPGRQLAQRRVGAGLRLQRAPRGAQQRRRVRRLVGRLDATGHALLRHLRGGAQPLGVLQPLRLGLQLGVLPRLRVDPGDLVQAQAQQVGLLVALAGVAPPVGQVVDDSAPPGVRLAQRVEQLLVLGAGEPVERGALLGRAQQPELVGLAVHGQHLLTDLAERGHRHGAPAQVRPGAALDRHGAAEQQ